MKYLNQLINRIKFKIALFFLRRYDDLIIFYQKLCPSTYFSGMRVLELNTSEIKKGDNVCIFIIYEHMEIPQLTWDAINTIKAMGIKIFLVVNSKLSEEEKNKIRKTADISMFRNNTGKDIGGYKDAFLHLYQNDYLKKINRLIFANDSIVYPQKYIKPIFTELVNRSANLIGYSEVIEIAYHVQSFLFSCDNALINDNIFIKFWKKYLPVDRRRYLIHKGEVAITRAVLKTGKTISCINNISKLNDSNLDEDKLIEIIYSLPTMTVRNLTIFEEVKKICKSSKLSLSSMLKDIRIIGESEALSLLIDNARKLNKLELKNFFYELIYELGSRNNTAWNTFIFLQLGLPVVIKRDSLYRAGYDKILFEIFIRKYFDNKESDQILSMVKAPARNHFKGMKKIMFDSGII